MGYDTDKFLKLIENDRSHHEVEFWICLYFAEINFQFQTVKTPFSKFSLHQIFSLTFFPSVFLQCLLPFEHLKKLLLV